MKKDKEFRESIRLLERQLGIMKKYTNDCCAQVTLAQCHTLVEIGRATSLSLKELSALLGLDISTMSRTVDTLVKKNLVDRVSDSQDRRSVRITLTPEGLLLYSHIETENDSYFSELYHSIPQEDQIQVLKSLKVLAEAFQKIDPSIPGQKNN